VNRKPRYIHRDAATGRFVSAAYAKANPQTTVRERVATRCQK
jgi:hypothetical protein